MALYPSPDRCSRLLGVEAADVWRVRPELLGIGQFMRRFYAVNRPDIDSSQPTGTQEHVRTAKVSALGKPTVIRNYLHLRARQRSYTVDAEIDAGTSAATA